MKKASFLMILFSLAAFNAWGACTEEGQPAGTEGCCVGLKADTAGVCQDTPVNDNSLVRCSDHAQCSNGEGCFSLTMDDIYKDDPEKMEDILKSQNKYLGDSEPREAGKKCVFNFECESLSCKWEGMVRKCEDIKGCRRGNADETVPPQVLCDDGLKKVGDKCVFDTTQIYGSTDTNFTPSTSSNNQCIFNYDENKWKIAQNAMKSLRAMEMLFNNPTEDNNECFINLVKYLQDNVGVPLREERKKLIHWFNSEWKLIEKDAEIIMNASEKSDVYVTVADMKMKEKEVAQRRTIGIDMLLIMKRRVQIMQKYEQGMEAITNRYAEKLAALDKEFSEWGEKSKEWKINSVTYRGKDHKCRGVLPMNWFNRKIKNRWHRFYQVEDKALNFDLVKHKTFGLSMAQIFQIPGTSEAEILLKTKLDLFLKSYYLVDPLLPADQNGNDVFRQYGHPKHFLADPNRRRELQEEADLTKMMDYFGRKWDLIQSQFAADANGVDVPDFIIEPELVSTSARGCHNPTSVSTVTSKNTACGEFLKAQGAEIGVCRNNPDKAGCNALLAEAGKCEAVSSNVKACTEYTQMMKDLTETSFAQFIAYSKHKKQKYKDYFQNVNSGRRKLFAHYQSSYINLENYYKDISTHREQQLKCIEAQINKAGDYLDNMVSFDDGLNNYYDGKEYTEEKNQKNPKPKRRAEESSRRAFEIRLNQGVLKALNSSGNKQYVDQGTAGGSGFVDAAGKASLAARIKTVKDANAKAAAAGLDVASRMKATEAAILASVKQGSGIGAGSLSANAGGAAGGAMAAAPHGMNNQNAALDSNEHNKNDDGKNKDGSDADKNKNGKNSSVTVPGMAGGAAGGAWGSGIAGGSNSGSGSGSGSEGQGAYQDQSGMSDEEKDVMMANYERNKSEYKSNEDDTLFKVLSKAYVRNLDKVLTKKKRIEE